MKISFKLFLFISILFFSINLFGQKNNQQLVIQKTSNSNKEVLIAPNSRFKAKTINGEKIKGTFGFLTDKYIVYNENDTLLFNDISWIKAKRNLTKTQGFIALGVVLVGAYFTLPMIPGSLMIFALNENPLIFLVPLSTSALTIGSFRILSGRRYNSEKWHFKVKQVSQVIN